jgi:hypothetical protein
VNTYFCAILESTLACKTGTICGGMRRAAEKTYLHARDLAHGWDYRPDWRHNVVDAYLVEQADKDPLDALVGEEDAYVRQYSLYRRTGRCLKVQPFAWAYRCHTSNPTTGAGSLIKALTIAKVPADEIASKLRTGTAAILVYQKLFFDVVRYLDDSAWIASLVFCPLSPEAGAAELRERNLMAAGFIRGERAVGQLFDPRIRLSPAEREERIADIQNGLALRAAEYVQRLELTGSAPTREDLDSMLRLMDTTSRQPQRDDSSNRMTLFIAALHGQLKEKAALPEYANNPVLKMIREVDEEIASETCRNSAKPKVLTW